MGRAGDYLVEWLRGRQPHLAPTTFASYGQTILKHLLPALGFVPLAKLSRQAVREYLAKKLESLSPRSAAYHRMILRRALQDAVRDGLLSRNPVDLVQSPPQRRKEMRTLDAEQVRLFLGEARRTSPYYRLYLTAIATGMRRGELLGLRWQDLDLLAGRPRSGAGKGPEWNALKRGRRPKARNEAMRKFWAWVKEHEASIHRDQFLANDQGAFDARARRGRRQVLVQRASVKLSNPEVLAVGGDVSDDHFEGAFKE